MMHRTPVSTVAAGTAPATAPHVERSEYRYVGGGKFEPANEAAWREVERWNAFADAWNARLTHRITAS